MKNTNKNNNSSNLYDDGNIPEIDLPKDKKSDESAKPLPKRTQKNEPDRNDDI